MGNEEFSMKNLKFLGIIALAVVIGFAFIACPGEEEEEGEPTVPEAVATFNATPGDTKVDLRWTAPAKDGGSAITGYEVTKDNWTTKVSKAANELTHTFTGLTNGVEVTFKVRAINEIGAGAEKEVKATPTDVAPPPGSGVNLPILYDGTDWADEVGTVTADLDNEGNNTVIVLQHAVDITSYSKLVIEGIDTTSYYIGGQLGNMDLNKQQGYWSGITLDTNNVNGKASFDLSAVTGFTEVDEIVIGADITKGSNGLTVSSLYFE